MSEITPISLTDFVDFVIRAGVPKLTKVREIKARPPYLPVFDFWKTLREGIIESVRRGSPLEGVLDSLTDLKKIGRYSDAVKAFKKWAKKKPIEWFDPPSDLWVYQSLTVRVNPELGIRVNGIPYVVKLYFKNEPLTPRRLAVVLQIMKSALNSSATVAVLDIGQSRLLLQTNGAIDMTPLLIGEAASFVTIWNAT